MSSSGIWSLAEPGLCLSLSDEFKADKVRNILKQFTLTDEDVKSLKILFDKEMDDGLKKDNTSSPANTSKMAMDVTYFTELFDGTENGDFVVINLTAQNLILALATIRPGFPVKTVRKYFTIDENVRSSPYIKIFEYLCDCLLTFFTENSLLNKMQILGFSTNLPIIQFGIDRAIINYFTIAASDFPLNFYDIRKCFETVLLKERYKEIQFILAAILNNNMSLLIYYSYLYGSIDIFINLEDDCGLIYQETTNNVHKWKSTYSEEKKGPSNSELSTCISDFQTQINIVTIKVSYKILPAKFQSQADAQPQRMETVLNEVFIDSGIRNFGRSGSLNFMTTSLDWSVISEPLSWTHADKECRLEKFLAEKYILELIRRILMTLHHELLYCREGDIGQLYKVNGISLSDVVNLIKEKDLNHASQLLPAGTIGVSNEDALVAKYVCSIVLIRSALLISICLSRILLKSREDDFIIAIKSPLLEKSVDYETYIRNLMENLAPQKKFQILKVKDDDSVEGGALATSVISRLKEERC